MELASVRIFVHADDPSGNTITFLQRPTQSSAEGNP
jgi:hypothetical protein